MPLEQRTAIHSHYTRITLWGLTNRINAKSKPGFPRWDYSNQESVERNRHGVQVLSIGNRKIVTDAANPALVCGAFQHDLAEMLVCFHVGEGFRDLFEAIDAVDGHAQFAYGDCVAKVSLHQSCNLAYFSYGARAERDADIVDAAGGM
jgi:hypothetical protein